ncbi:MAG: hypothetical protein ACK4ND_17160, partial [Cytophagaceae bacterium]
MIRAIRDTLLATKKVCGMEIVLGGAMPLQMHLTLLEIRKKELHCLETNGVLLEEEQLNNPAMKGVPVCLAVTGKGILHKRLPSIENPDKREIVSQILPDARAEDFYFQFSEGDGYTYVSIIRKELLDNILEVFRKCNKYVLNISLGPFALEGVHELLGVEEIYTGVQTISFSGEKIAAISSSASIEKNIPYKIDKEEIAPHLLLSYSTAFNCLLNIAYPCLQDHPLVSESNSEHTNRKIFTIAGWSV